MVIIKRLSGSSVTNTIKTVDAKEMRFPTAVPHYRSDQKNSSPDYSCVYISTKLKSGSIGNAVIFTMGYGAKVIIKAVEVVKSLILYQTLDEIVNDFGLFYRNLQHHGAIKSVGMNKGVIQLAMAGVINSLWDLWAKLENKPLWRLLVMMEPEALVSTMDFQYVSDVLTEEEAVEILRSTDEFDQVIRTDVIEKKGYPANTIEAGWMGMSEKHIVDICERSLDEGFKTFKVLIGQNLEDDMMRLRIIRKIVGWSEAKLILRANETFEVSKAISYIKKLKKFRIFCVEEPTASEDVFGHQQIANAVNKFKIAISAGENCTNRTMVKQYLKTKAVQFINLDITKMPINEALIIYLMAHKFGIKISARGCGIGQGLIRHLQAWEYICLSGDMEDKTIEFENEPVAYFFNPLELVQGCYKLPKTPGCSTTLKVSTMLTYSFPNGRAWKSLQEMGLYSSAIRVTMLEKRYSGINIPTIITVEDEIDEDESDGSDYIALSQLDMLLDYL